jgi:tetraacyldisaccharide 4'-kinase
MDVSSRHWFRRSIRPLLGVLALVYGAVVRLRVALYATGWFGLAKRLPGRVISVGNLTVGGTGKTPCVAWIARYLHAEGEQVAILSRGYRRESRGRVEVSDGARVLATPQEAGDEPWLLARSCPGVRVVVDHRRYEAGRWLHETVAAERGVAVFLLDDGYQHLQLARDLNLLLVDAGDPLPQARLAPLGRLREPLSQLRRADAVIITRSDQPYDERALDQLLQRYLRPATPVFHAAHELTSLSDWESGERVEVAQLGGRMVAAIAGIARPARFYDDLRRLGLNLGWTRSFPDHHRYRPADLAEIAAAAQAAGAAAVLMTEKDAANWPPGSPIGLPLLVARIEFRCREEQALKSLLRRRVATSPGARGEV